MMHAHTWTARALLHTQKKEEEKMTVERFIGELETLKEKYKQTKETRECYLLVKRVLEEYANCIQYREARRRLNNGA